MFIEVRSYDNYISANIMLQRLQQEGINCWLENETMVTIGPFLSNSIGGIKLMVHEAQLERVLELLEIFEKPSSFNP